jgi:beta-lactamase class A
VTVRTLSGQPAQRAILATKLRTELHRIADETKGVVGAQVLDLATGERIGVNDTLTFPQGSAIKIPLLIELYHQDDAGTLKLSTRVPVRPPIARRQRPAPEPGDGTSELSLATSRCS